MPVSKRLRPEPEEEDSLAFNEVETSTEDQMCESHGGEGFAA